MNIKTPLRTEERIGEKWVRGIYDKEGTLIGHVDGDKSSDIIRAINSHEALVRALKSILSNSDHKDECQTKYSDKNCNCGFDDADELCMSALELAEGEK